MTEQLEIEFKTLLSAKDYHKIYQYYQFENQPFIDQTNIYFDTPSQALQKKRFGLRIRCFEEEGELTLKCPTKGHGLLEITDQLSAVQLDSLLDQQTILKSGAVANALLDAGIDIDQLKPIARLRTKRYEKQLAIGLLALDESWYGQHHDYELELEVSDEIQGKINFKALLSHFDLPYTPGENKIIRAIKNQ